MLTIEEIRWASYRVNRTLIRGIYFLLKDNEIVYVGKSDNVMKRISQHIVADEKMFDSYCVLPVKDEDLSTVEARYIWEFAPRHNKSVPKNEHCKTLTEVRLMYSDYGLSLLDIEEIAYEYNIEHRSKWYDFKSLDAAIRAHLGIIGENNE
ncbi:MAG: hypothetical protein WC359_13325 [Dehalococcoidia bacterium]|jgi:hypothetical protein